MIERGFENIGHTHITKMAALKSVKAVPSPTVKG